MQNGLEDERRFRYEESAYETYENQSLERILECAIVVSWADLMRDAQTGLIHH
jgi:hypothetical protein